MICKYFPCHKLESELFDCEYCYCPLYHFDCPGDYVWLVGKVKDCSSCTLPHDLSRRKEFEDAAKQLLPGAIHLPPA